MRVKHEKRLFQERFQGATKKNRKQTNRPKFHHAQELRILDSHASMHKKISRRIRQHRHSSERKRLTHFRETR